MASTCADSARYVTQDQRTHASEEDANRPSTSASPSLTVSIQSPNPSNAFHGLVPSTYTSTGRSKMLVKKVPYDVFINHRGPDVKEGLASDLYNTLNGMGLRVFLDKQELEVGDSFPREIEEAITGALIHLAIFSENYAHSPWCLAELSLMLKTGTKIIPIFYHIQTDVVRYAKGTYAEAFARYEQKRRYSSTMLQEWKDALTNVSYNIGHIIQTKDDEMNLLKNIANHAVREIKNVPLVIAKHPVGLDELAVEVFGMTTLQSAVSHPAVQIVGIWGMGGVGKTTLAKKLYNINYKTMERSSFLLDIRDAADKSVLHLKQKKLLEDLGFKGKEVEKVENVEEGKGLLASYLRSVRVLIVLDDVDKVEQLDDLVPVKDNLKQGSLIVVTTRQSEVLTGWGISSSSIYKMKGLNTSHSEQLFCWHAFLQPFPKEGFAELVEKFIKFCHGLPLSLKVFGGQLYGKHEPYYWESQLEKIEKILPGDIMNSLKVSYEALDTEEREAFLDAACFFIGENKSLAIEAWNGSEGHGICSLETLVSRCLVEIDWQDCIKMHDHLRDLGRNISMQLSPQRLYSYNQIIDVHSHTILKRIIQYLQSTLLHTNMKVGKQIEKRISIRGIVATSARFVWYGNRESFTRAVPDKSSHEGRKVVFETNEGNWALSPSLGGLKFIVVQGHDLNHVLGEASRELVWLRWCHPRQRNLPSRLSLKNLRVLEIFEDYRKGNHLKELWNDASDAPIQLRVLNICGCSNFRRFPESIGSLKHLKKIVIGYGGQIKNLPRGFCLLQSLEHLELACWELSSLPDNFGDLRNLRHLVLYGREQMKRLPVSFKRLTLLQHLHLRGMRELTLESDVMIHMTKLEHVALVYLNKLEKLPLHITNQRFLIQLHLRTHNVREVPVNISQLSRLQSLTISSDSLTSLPTSLGDLSSLTCLSIQDCSNLESLPESLGDLSSLTTLYIQHCSNLESLPESLGDLSSLTSLYIFTCPNLESLPESLGRLSMLEHFNVSSTGVKSIALGELINLQGLDIAHCPVSELWVGELINLEELWIDHCQISELDLVSGSLNSSLCNLKKIDIRSTGLSKISISEYCCLSLETLTLRNNGNLVEIQELPKTIEEIRLHSCPKLSTLPSFAQFSSLREFLLIGCYGVQKIRGLEDCTALEELKVHSRWEEGGIESLERMERLRKVELNATSRSGVESCIESVIKKWPKEEVIVCTAAVPRLAPWMAALLNVSDSDFTPWIRAWIRASSNVSFTNRRFGDVLVNSFTNRCPDFTSFEWPSAVHCILLCFVINCEHSFSLSFDDMGSKFCEFGMFDGKRRVWTALFTPHSRVHKCIRNSKNRNGGVVEKGVILTGEEERMKQVFTHILASLSC